jgi:hypothetical protein
MLDLLKSAITDERNEEYSFFLSGDLSQMSNQRTFLSNRGFSLKQNNVYPCLRKCDVEKAMKLIWEQKADGWWHYCDKYVELNICTKEDISNYWNKK